MPSSPVLVHTHDYDASYLPAIPLIRIQIARRMGAEYADTAVELTALVDSGADVTQIPLPILQQLSARQSRTGWLSGAAGGRYRVDLYKVALQVGTARPMYVDVVGTRYDEVIVGRDVLNHFVVTLDALGLMVTLSA